MTHAVGIPNRIDGYTSCSSTTRTKQHYSAIKYVANNHKLIIKLSHKHQFIHIPSQAICLG